MSKSQLFDGKGNLCHHSGSMVENLPASAGGRSSIPGSGSSPGDRNGNPLQRLPFSTGKSHGQRSLVGYSSRSHKRVGHDLETKEQ